MRTTAVSVTAMALAMIQAAPAFAGTTVDATATEAATAPAADEGEAIIVTGTRATGITQAQSATPIKVLDDAALSKVGQPNLNQALTQLVPSFTAQAFGGDTANLTLSAKLRGLSPNHTLVLVNGKRRHGTANLAVLGGPFQGAASTDIDLISPASIERIEVLEQGAAAQYGSDAIAGVINIILKKNSEGGTFIGTGGSNYSTGGLTGAAQLNLGYRLGDNGFLNLTAFHRYHDFTQVGGLDGRVTDASGNLLSGFSAIKSQYYSTIAGMPYVNRINGDARSHLTNLQYNTGYTVGSVDFYSFGSYSRRIASAYENLRVPDKIVASSTLGTAGTLGGSGAIVYAPSGFNPREAIHEDDFSFTGGAKGTVAGFGFDLSGTWGQDKNLIYTLDSGNRSLFIDTHFTPSDFYDGSFRNTEWTLNADFTRSLEVGLAKPLDLAFGAEYKKNIYAIGAGDAGSIYKEGGQSFPGFRPSDAGSHNRHNVALYLDASLHPVDKLLVDGAVRWEHYSDFGSTTTYKVTSRYDFTDAVALRGTISTGFRAPTLAESYYSATNVGPTTAFVQLPANSAAAKLLGFSNLKPEKSVSYSIGGVFRPAPRLTITLDMFQVRIKDRILGTGSIYGSGGAVNYPIVTQAIIANGNVLDPTVSTTGINIFTNGADTRTRGIDLMASYLTPLGNMGKINWTLSGTYNQTKVTRQSSITLPGSSSAIGLFDQAAISYLETASPRVKIVTSADWTKGPFDIMLRGTLYGVSKAYASPDGGTYYLERIPTAFIVDTEWSYTIGKALTLTMGANNLFDKRAPTVGIVPGSASSTSGGYNWGGGAVLDSPMSFSPYGINGGYYYGRVTLKF